MPNCNGRLCGLRAICPGNMGLSRGSSPLLAAPPTHVSVCTLACASPRHNLGSPIRLCGGRVASLFIGNRNLGGRKDVGRVQTKRSSIRSRGRGLRANAHILAGSCTCKLEISTAGLYTFSCVRHLEAVPRAPSGIAAGRMGHHGRRLGRRRLRRIRPVDSPVTRTLMQFDFKFRICAFNSKLSTLNCSPK
jgi:hypothetical protein